MMRCTFHMMGGFRIDLDRLNLTEKILSNTLADEKAVFEMRPNAGGDAPDPGEECPLRRDPSRGRWDSSGPRVRRHTFEVSS